tara:strand:+ start:3071 stop:5533 length:2463 start_codon:yes stop_codon:yes gene_type:complete
MANPNKFTSKEVLNKVLLDSSGNAVTANSVTTQEALNSVLDTTNNRLNMSLAGGTISGDVTISGDLTVNGGGSLAFDEILQGTQVIDVTNTEAFLVRKDSDAGDVMVVDTTNSRVGIGKSPDTLLHLYSTSASKPILKIENEQGGGNPVSIQMLRNTISPADDDFIGQIDFRSMNDAGTPEETLYAYISSQSTDITDGTEDGEINFFTMKAGTLARTMTIQSGEVGINDSDPAKILSVKATGNDDGICLKNSSGQFLALLHQQDSDAGMLRLYDASSTTKIAFNADAGETSYFNNGGVLMVGHTSPTNTGNLTAQAQIETTGSGSALAITRNTNGAFGSYLVLAKTRSGTVGGSTILQDDDEIGTVRFSGADGNDRASHAAEISGQVDGTPGSNDMPGRLVFKTTSDGANSATERARITSSGDVGVGTQSPNFNSTAKALTVLGGDSEDIGSVEIIGHTDSGNTAVSRLYMGNRAGSQDDLVYLETKTGTGASDGVLCFYTSSSGTPTKNFELDANSRMSLSNNDSGTDNTVFGFLAGASIASDGIQNVFIGDYAGNATTTGDYNVAIGKGAMLDNVDGSFNTAVGRLALENFEPSSGGDGHNTAMGATAGNDISTGTNNTCIGSNSGHDGTNNLTTGTQNTFLGAYTNGSGANAGNQTVIGYNADGTGDNEIAIGNTSISAIKAQVTSITAYSSDERTKKDVADYDLKGVDFIKELKLKTYLYKNPADFPDEIRHSKWDAKDEDGNLIHERPSDPTETQVGLIAQEVEAAIAKHGVGNVETYAPTQDSGIKTLTYGNLIFPLIKAVQELSARVEELESK